MIIKTKKFILRPPKKGDENSLWDGKAVGEIDVELFDPHHKKKAKIGYWTGEKYRRRGIVTKSVTLAVPYWMKKYQLKRVEARARTYNHKNSQNLRLRHKWRSLFEDFSHSEFLSSQKASIHLRIKKRSLLAFSDKPSARVLEKAGFKREGILKKNVLKGGKLYDDFLYARVR